MHVYWYQYSVITLLKYTSYFQLEEAKRRLGGGQPQHALPGQPRPQPHGGVLGQMLPPHGVPGHHHLQAPLQHGGPGHLQHGGPGHLMQHGGGPGHPHGNLSLGAVGGVGGGGGYHSNSSTLRRQQPSVPQQKALTAAEVTVAGMSTV